MVFLLDNDRARRLVPNPLKYGKSVNKMHQPWVSSSLWAAIAVRRPLRQLARGIVPITTGQIHLADVLIVPLAVILT